VFAPSRYHVDRQKSVDVLKDFLDKKDTKLQEERAWLLETKVDCVLSDAAFLGWYVVIQFYSSLSIDNDICYPLADKIQSSSKCGRIALYSHHKFHFRLGI
jgi:hypothetical protein